MGDHRLYFNNRGDNLDRRCWQPPVRRVLRCAGAKLPIGAVLHFGAVARKWGWLRFAGGKHSTMARIKAS